MDVSDDDLGVVFGIVGVFADFGSWKLLGNRVISRWQGRWCKELLEKFVVHVFRGCPKDAIDGLEAKRLH